MAVFVLKHALALAHASRGGKCKSRIPFPKGERSEGLHKPKARKIKVALARARDGGPQQVWFPYSYAPAYRVAFGELRVPPLGWGASKTALLLRWLEPGKGADLPRTSR